MRKLSARNTSLRGPGLGQLTGLTELDLSGTPINDEGLRHLYGLTQLRTLRLINTEATAAGIEELRKKLPNVTVEQ